MDIKLAAQQCKEKEKNMDENYQLERKTRFIKVICLPNKKRKKNK